VTARPAYLAPPIPRPWWHRLVPAGVAVLAAAQLWAGRRLWPND
jgi:hypothetical protein